MAEEKERKGWEILGNGLGGYESGSKRKLLTGVTAGTSPDD